MITKILAIALEAVGAAVVVAGLAVECTMHADIGYICITAGASVVALGGLAWKFVKVK